MNASAIHKKFSKLMSIGKVSAEMKCLEECSPPGLLEVTPEVLQSLKEKHPPAEPLSLKGLIRGPCGNVPSVLFDNITGEDIFLSASHTKGGSPGIRPVVIGESLRRVMRKTVTLKFRNNLMQAAGPLSRSEAAVHEACSSLEDTDSGCIC